MEQTKPYRVLLYYKYVEIENPEAFAAEHLQFCKETGLKGRILVAKEGINGTVSERLNKQPNIKKRCTPIPGSGTWSLKKMKQMAMRLKNARPPAQGTCYAAA